MCIYYVKMASILCINSVLSLYISGHLTGRLCTYISVQAARLTAACTQLKKSACDLLEDQAANWANANTDGERNIGFQLAELYTLYLNTVSSSLKVSTLARYVVKQCDILH